MTHLLCPHCQTTISYPDRPPEEVLCPHCGSSFRLESGLSTVNQPEGVVQTLGRFHLLALIGTGAFGIVYRAFDPQLDRTVAVKMPRTGNLESGEHLDRFLREARSVAQLRHPSIVSVHEVGQQ